MLAQFGLCQTWSETTLLVFSCAGSYDMFVATEELPQSDIGVDDYEEPIPKQEPALPRKITKTPILNIHFRPSMLQKWFTGTLNINNSDNNNKLQQKEQLISNLIVIMVVL